MIKALIFDLDGVLVSTDNFHYQAWKKMADEEGIYFDQKINNRLRGVSRMDSLNIILERSTRIYSPKEKEALAERKNNIYREMLKTLNYQDIKEETRATLTFLKKVGIYLAIGSSSKNAKTITFYTGLDSYFDVIVDGTMITHSKPDPEVFLKAAALLQVSPKESAVIEDAEAGIKAAKAGDFTAIGFGKEVKDDILSDFVINDISELKRILKEEQCLR